MKSDGDERRVVVDQRFMGDGKESPTTHGGVGVFPHQIEDSSVRFVKFDQIQLEARKIVSGAGPIAAKKSGEGVTKEKPFDFCRRSKIFGAVGGKSEGGYDLRKMACLYG